MSTTAPGPAVKVSISLPGPTLARADRVCAATGESRSELFRRALQALFDSERERASIRRYVEGYIAEPESDYEVAVATATGGTYLDAEDWD
jgi:metal-responsive CopG/Arc/MetJ family transcriptional regulator